MQIAFSHHVVPLNNNNRYLSIIIVSGYYNKKIWTDIEQTLMSKNILAVKFSNGYFADKGINPFMASVNVRGTTEMWWLKCLVQWRWKECWVQDFVAIHLGSRSLELLAHRGCTVYHIVILKIQTKPCKIHTKHVCFGGSLVL